MPVIQIISIIVAMLVGSGAVAFFLRYHTRLVLVERDSEKALKKTEDHAKDLAANKERVVIMEQTLNQIRESLLKLNTIERIASSVDVLAVRVDDNRKDTSELRMEVRELLKSVTSVTVTTIGKQ